MSEVKVNKISPRTACGTTTLGDSGDTFTIPAGVTITNSGTAAGFGSTGEVSWNTTKVTSGFTASSGVGYFADTSGGAFTITLPASPSSGNVVAISDYKGFFATNNITVGRNSSNINGDASDFILKTDNTTAQFIYVDATEGWRLVFTGSLTNLTPSFIQATGGTITCSGNFKIHTFTSPGTFTISSLSCIPSNNSVDYLVVAGGGGGGLGTANLGGGGGAGAGGYRESSGTTTGCYTVSPLGTCVSALPVSIQAYPIAVGGGGAGSNSEPQRGVSGSDSTFSTITSGGGGGGGSGSATACRQQEGGNGGSGGGAGSDDPGGAAAGTGNTPPVNPPQGNSGGGPNTSGGYGSGGGGATQAGSQPPTGGGPGGPGGDGATSSINATPTARAGGGGGGLYHTGPGCAGTGGAGGGGNGGKGAVGSAGSVNTGGGAGGGGRISPGVPAAGGAGGSGIVIIRYKFQ